VKRCSRRESHHHHHRCFLARSTTSPARSFRLSPVTLWMLPFSTEATICANCSITRSHVHTPHSLHRRSFCGALVTHDMCRVPHTQRRGTCVINVVSGTSIDRASIHRLHTSQPMLTLLSAFDSRALHVTPPVVSSRPFSIRHGGSQWLV
jgi:hypothetical protein